MSRILLALLMLKAVSLMAADDHSQPFGAYQLVSVFRMGEHVEAVVLRSGTDQRFRLREGVSLDGYTVVNIVPDSHASYVELERDGTRGQITMARAGELNFVRPQKSLAELKGHVDATGRLTESGQRRIRHNLIMLARSAQAHMASTGGDKVDFQTLVRDYGGGSASYDPFAAPSDEQRFQQFLIELDPVAGENYTTISVLRHAPKIGIRTASGELVEIEFAKQFPLPSRNAGIAALFEN